MTHTDVLQFGFEFIAAPEQKGVVVRRQPLGLGQPLADLLSTAAITPRRAGYLITLSHSLHTHPQLERYPWY